MSRSSEAASLATAIFWVGLLSSLSRTQWWKPSQSDKGGRGAGPGATTTPVPQGGANLWSEVTMRVFANQMYQAGVGARLVLLGIAASSNFNADEALGENTGLLMLRREHLAEVGYPEEPPFEELDAVHQIPWIAKVIAYRMASTGGRAPTTIGELAALLHPSSSAVIAQVIKAEAERRAAAAQGTSIFIAHDNLLRKVLANP